MSSLSSDNEKSFLQKHWRKIVFVFGVGVLIIGILYLCLALHVSSYVSSSSQKKTDTAIVLGARVYKDGGYNPCLISRVKTGVKLYKEKKVKTLIVSGGDNKEEVKKRDKELQDFVNKYMKDSMGISYPSNGANGHILFNREEYNKLTKLTPAEKNNTRHCPVI